MRANKTQVTYQWYPENGVEGGVVTVLSDAIPRDGDWVLLDVESAGQKFEISAYVEWVQWEIGKTETSVRISLYKVQKPFVHRQEEGS